MQDPENLHRAAETCHDEHGVWGVSVQSGIDATLLDLVADLPHNQVRRTTVGRLRNAGFHVYPSPREGNPRHGTVILSPEQPPDDPTVGLFMAAFDPPQPRPRM